MTGNLQPSVIVRRARQIQGLFNDPCSDTFENTSQEPKTIFMVFEISKASVVIFLLGRGGRSLKTLFAGESIENPNVL